MNAHAAAVATLANGKTFEAPADRSLLDAAQAAGLVLEHSCRSGRCGSCKARLVSGRVVALQPDLSLTAAEQAQGWRLTCTSAAAGDVSLDIEDLGLPADLKPRTLPCRIASLQRLAPDVLRVELRLPPNAGFHHLSGQSIDVIAAGGLRRSYSLANAGNGADTGASDGPLELHIRQVPGGQLSRYWFEQAKPGDLLRFEGPRGTFFLRDVAGLDLVFLATGTGIAPVKAMLAGLAQAPAQARPRSLRLLWGGRSAADLYWQPAAGGMALDYTPVLSRPHDGWDGARGHVQDVLLQAPPDWTHSAVYACGSAAMVAGARAALRAAGLPARRFFADAFVPSSP
jgi:CDP-4-dehydro-6-deoxyglucose reductase